jgi:prolyl oligopeptidase
MTAYGGFGVSFTPYYDGAIGKLWLEKGGAFVLANIRGGGELGPAWHEAGRKTNRQRVYDDFAAVGEDLIRRKITGPPRLGIIGGSNGGLLMGVEMIQRPDLWRAVVIKVPLLDMLRYEQIAAGASWVDEYGSVSVPNEREFLASISPYANLKRDGGYPEPLIWTITKDDRVGPAHARKFAARMKEYGLPYLYYENTAGGHSRGCRSETGGRAGCSGFNLFYSQADARDRAELTAQGVKSTLAWMCRNSARSHRNHSPQVIEVKVPQVTVGPALHTEPLPNSAMVSAIAA